MAKDQQKAAAAQKPAIPTASADAPIALPDAVAARLRRVKAKCEAMHQQAEAIYQHELNEAAQEIGAKPGEQITIDVDAGLFVRRLQNQ